MTKTAGLLAIERRVMWTRLVAVVEEQAQALLRTAFGAVVREAGDLSAGVYDLRGRMLAQAVTGTPGHVNTMAMAVAHFLARFPPAAMRPGDVFVTNDPWMGTGHLFDYVVLTPAFLGPRPVGFLASTCHVTDVGGRGFSAEARSVFEEGTRIPHLRLRREGTMNDDVLAIVAANSRSPVEVLGDLRSLVSGNDVGAARLAAMLGEFGLDGLDELAEFILEASERATKAAIAAVPDGTWEAAMTIDGYEAPLTLRGRMTVAGETVTFDYAGSSPASAYGINSPKCYTDAYTVFGLKCVIAPETPNNNASLGCFRVLAEPGSCVAPEDPAPVSARHVIGQMLPDLVFGCLAQALPEATPAESAGSIWVLAMSDAGEGPPFTVMNVGIGGMGAAPFADGLATTAFPSGVGGIPVEVTETDAPVIFRRKEFIADSGGAGRYRGGLGQRIEITHAAGAPFRISAATWDRMRFPPRGRAGGLDGRAGAARLLSGAPLAGKVLHAVPAGGMIVVELPGGGGFGDPRERPASEVAADVAAGYVSAEAARRDYVRSGGE